MTDRKEKAMLAVLEQGELICVDWATLMAILQLYDRSRALGQRLSLAV